MSCFDVTGIISVSVYFNKLLVPVYWCILLLKHAWGSVVNSLQSEPKATMYLNSAISVSLPDLRTTQLRVAVTVGHIHNTSLIDCESESNHGV